MTSQINTLDNTKSRWSWLYKITGAAALTAGLLLVIGLLNLAASFWQAEAALRWLTVLGNNWLILIFKLHAEFSDVYTEMLRGSNPLDMFFLITVGLISFGLSTVHQKARKVILLIAGVLSAIGLLLYFATQMAGRSTVMVVVLIISLVMPGNGNFGKAVVYTGVAAGILLLVGDITVGMKSSVITFLFGAGYVFLVVWFFLIAKIFFSLGVGGIIVDEKHK